MTGEGDTTDTTVAVTMGARNLGTSKWIAPEGLNVYDVLNHDHQVMTQASAKLVEQALRG